MGTHENDCFGNFTLCPRGTSFSIWFKFGPLIDGNADFMTTTNMFIYMYKKANNSFGIAAEIANDTHVYKFYALPAFSPNTWIQLGMTYSKASGFKVG